MQENVVEIYTDGSCHTHYLVGTWVAIIFIGTKRKTLSAVVTHTTHNRMELMAVIKGLEHVLFHYPGAVGINVYTDSQYVTGLPARKSKLVTTDFRNSKGDSLQNADLVKKLFELISLVSIEFIKLKAHQKRDDTVNYNREADLLARKLLREAVAADYR
jgi:ribonuclease HI